ncbi:MAG: hypothetical protein ACLPID_01525 [Beijerinckiaceae bacterium]
MQTSIFIAKLLGPVFVLVGIALLFRPQAFRVLLQEFIASHVLIYLAGVLGLLGGLALVLTHNVWLLDWRLIVTLIGWLTLVRSVVTIFQPQLIVSAGSKLLEHREIFVGASAIDLVIGLALSYFGYSA